MGGTRNLTVCIIGTGNVATRLALRLQECGHTITAIAGRNADSAQRLASMLHPATLVTDIPNLPPSDICIIAVNDDAILSVLEATADNGALWVHTSGATPIDVFKGKRKRYGSLYPLQTFSKDRETDFSAITTFVEANDSIETKLLQEFAATFSGKTASATSQQRLALHVAATFACNFPNFMVLLAYRLASLSGLNPRALAPLVEETMKKLQTMTPEEAQTGPARRADSSTIRHHLDALGDCPPLANLYSEISAMITDHFHPQLHNR